MLKIKKTSLQLTAIIAVFVLPSLISWLLFHYHAHLNFGTTQHGKLINPAVTVADFAVSKDHPQWQIVYAPRRCGGEDYDKITYTLHQMHIALNKNYKRVSLAVLFNDQCRVSEAHDFRVITLNQQQLSKLQTMLDMQSLQGSIFLVDPLGNVFLVYPEQANPLDIFKDLKKVLEASQIG